MIAILPNIITVIRIIGSVALMFIDPLTVAFFIVYSIAGFSDAIDGYIARRFKVTSRLGALLDSIADLLFYAVMLIKVFPILWELLPQFIWIIVGLVIAVRIGAYVVAAIKYRRFASVHTYLNKLTGIIIFTVPYFLKLPIGPAVCYTVCAIAGLASIEELVIHIKSKEYDESHKSIFIKAPGTENSSAT